MRPLKDGYSKYTDIEICEMIGDNKIIGQWMNKDCHDMAKQATIETATEVLEKIDEIRYAGFNHWNMFN